MALDLAGLWDFAQPALSEQRFVAALADASGDEALILRTQIARSHGLRKDFTRARVELLQLQLQLEPDLAGASAEAQTRHALELASHWGQRLGAMPPS